MEPGYWNETRSKRHAVTRHGALGRSVPGGLQRRRVEELVEVRQVQVVLVHAADVAERARHRGLRLLEHDDVHRHRADRDQALDRRQARSTAPCRRRPACRSRRGRFAQTSRRRIVRRAIRGIELVERSRCSAPRPPRPETEQLDLLRVILARSITVSTYICSRVSGVRQRDRPERIAENLSSAHERRESPRRDQDGERDRRERREQWRRGRRA